MSIGGIEETPSVIDGTPVVERGANTELDRDAFLKLLITQLRNQDPLNPVSNEDFIAQQATFTQLEQQINLNESFEEFIADQKSLIESLGTILGSVQSTSFLGKTVEYDTDVLTIQDGQVDPLYFNLDRPASVGYSVFDGAGQLVHNSPQLAFDPGVGYSTEFDGTDSSGNALPDGNYRVEFNVTDTIGNVLEGSGYAKRAVNSIDFRTGSPIFRLSTGEVIEEGQILSVVN